MTPIALLAKHSSGELFDLLVTHSLLVTGKMLVLDSHSVTAYAKLSLSKRLSPIPAPRTSPALCRPTPRA